MTDQQSGRSADSLTDRPVARNVAGATPGAVVQKVRGLSDRAIAWLFISPTIFLLLAINIFPLIWTVYLSFTNYRANRPGRPIEVGRHAQLRAAAGQRGYLGLPAGDRPLRVSGP